MAGMGTLSYQTSKYKKMSKGHKSGMMKMGAKGKGKCEGYMPRSTKMH